MNEQTININNDIKEKLLKYQLSHVDNLSYSLKTHNRALDSSDTGTGKTYSSIAVAKNLNLKPFIICPKSVMNSWLKVLEFFNCDYYSVTNYETFQNAKQYVKNSLDNKIPCDFIKKLKIKCTKDSKNIINFDFEWDSPPDMLLIIDEAHKCKNKKTMNFKILKTIAKTNVKILLLSATICENIKKFSLYGFVLGLYDDKTNPLVWIKKIQGGYTNEMSAIHDHIFPEYASRMRIRDLGKMFPNNQVIAELYDMDCHEEIQKMYDLINDSVKLLQNKEETSSCFLARITYARMKIEQLKLPIIIEKTKDFLNEGCSVALFVNFNETLHKLADKLNTNCIICGDQTIHDRNINIQKFMQDESRVIICNIKSGGVGISLHDCNGNFPRVTLISPSWSASDILQALGRTFRAKGKTPVRQRIVFCKNTIEDTISKNIQEKIKNIANLNDNDINSYKIINLIEGDKKHDVYEGLSDF